MTKICALVLTIGGWCDRACAVHLTFTNVTLSEAQVVALVQVGRAADATEAMARLLATQPGLRGLLVPAAADDSNKASQADQAYYAEIFSSAAATFFPPGSPPLDRPYAHDPLIVARPSTPSLRT